MADLLEPAEGKNEQVPGRTRHVKLIDVMSEGAFAGASVDAGRDPGNGKGFCEAEKQKESGKEGGRS